MSPRPRDTDPKAYDVMMQRLREMTPEQRFAQAMALTKTVRELAWEGVRKRPPNASEDEIRRRFAIITLGKELAEKVYGRLEEGE